MIPRLIRVLAAIAMITASSYIFATHADNNVFVLLLASLFLPVGFIILFWKSI